MYSELLQPVQDVWFGPREIHIDHKGPAIDRYYVGREAFSVAAFFISLVVASLVEALTQLTYR